MPRGRCIFRRVRVSLPFSISSSLKIARVHDIARGSTALDCNECRSRRRAVRGNGAGERGIKMHKRPLQIYSSVVRATSTVPACRGPPRRETYFFPLMIFIYLECARTFPSLPSPPISSNLRSLANLVETVSLVNRLRHRPHFRPASFRLNGETKAEAEAKQLLLHGVVSFFFVRTPETRGTHRDSRRRVITRHQPREGKSVITNFTLAIGAVYRGID